MQTGTHTDPARIEASGVTAGYGRDPVIWDVSLRVRPGEFLGLIGPNGAGKSTLLRVLSGVLPPRQGRVLLSGQPLERLRARDRARLLAFVPQTEAALFDFTVRDIVLMGRHPYLAGLGGETDEDFAAVSRAMAATGVLSLADRLVTELSGGEHRRVLIARALAQSTPTLLLDEPTAHLDITHQAEILGILRNLVDESGASVVAALHDLNLAAEYCDRLILLSNGRAAAEGIPSAVLAPESLGCVYGAPITVLPSPLSGKPLVFPQPTSARLQ